MAMTLYVRPNLHVMTVITHMTLCSSPISRAASTASAATAAAEAAVAEAATVALAVAVAEAVI